MTYLVDNNVLSEFRKKQPCTTWLLLTGCGAT